MTFRNIAGADDTRVSTKVHISLRESKAHLNQKLPGAINDSQTFRGVDPVYESATRSYRDHEALRHEKGFSAHLLHNIPFGPVLQVVESCVWQSKHE